MKQRRLRALFLLHQVTIDRLIISQFLQLDISTAFGDDASRTLRSSFPCLLQSAVDSGRATMPRSVNRFKNCFTNFVCEINGLINTGPYMGHPLL